MQFFARRRHSSSTEFFLSSSKLWQTYNNFLNSAIKHVFFSFKGEQKNKIWQGREDDYRDRLICYSSIFFSTELKMNQIKQNVIFAVFFENIFFLQNKVMIRSSILFFA
jgi:hypothetical protein